MQSTFDSHLAAPPTARRRRRRFIWPITAIVILSALVGAIATAAVAPVWHGGTKTTIVQQAPATGTMVPGVADLYANVRPSVVKITGVSTGTGEGGTGSGLVLDKQGDILTNYHVVSGFNQLDVKLMDGTDVTASVKGSDPGDDLAIVQISTAADKLTPATLGDSDKVRVGDAVIAIGNPFDLEATLSEGVVSGAGRVLSSDNARALRQVIQTDAAINPGNSGGGLFNLNGELIGITNAIENPSGADVFAGIGYAIPVDTFKQYQAEMLAGQTVSHAKLGISLEDLTPAIASGLGLKVQQGVLVVAVDPGSGAAQGGLRGMTRGQPGDVIVSIDAHAVKTFDDLASYLDTKQAGDKVQITIVRSGSQMTLTISLDAWTS